MLVCVTTMLVKKVWCVSPVTGATEGEEAVVGGHEDDGETGATEEEAVCRWS